MSNESNADGSNVHLPIWGLIPWVVNGRASEAECLEVEAHLQDCADCRREHQFQQQLLAAMQTDLTAEASASDPAPAFERLQARIERSETAARKQAAEVLEPIRRRRSQVMLVAAVLIQAVCIAWLGGRLYEAGPTTGYRTLSSAAVPVISMATIHLVVSPELPAGDLQTLLASAGLQIVAGPTPAGVLSLAPQGDKQAVDVSLARLRADPRVRFAEPTGAALQ